MTDIRWRQRFEHYLRALATLNRVAGAIRHFEPSETERLALIQCFELTHELAWKVLKDYLEAQGEIGLIGSKNATRMAFKYHLIDQGDTWMAMIDSRNLTSHTYDEMQVEKIALKILGEYIVLFIALASKFSAIADQPEI